MSSSQSVRATYDADLEILYVYLPGHPDTPACVRGTIERDGLLIDVDHEGHEIGMEIHLARALEVHSGDNGETRTGNAI